MLSLSGGNCSGYNEAHSPALTGKGLSMRDNGSGGVSARDGRVALVTGSSRGIGAAIAAELARRGAAVAVHGRDKSAADDVATAIARDGGKAMAVTGDVTSFEQV